MDKVTKAVIPAAGWGTRLLPATKAIPKELIPIINVPTLQYIVKEAADAGIKELLIVISKNKHAIKKHFSRNAQLEKELLAKNKLSLLQEVKASNKMLKIKYVYQDEQLGLGHAIGCAEKFANGKPIAVLLGDDVVVAKTPALGQCISAYNRTGWSVVGVQEVEDKHVSKYGIVKPVKKTDSNIFAINDLVEKPSVAEAPSRFAILGRYVLTPDIFQAIKDTPKDKSGEIQITNAIKQLLKNKKHVYACNFDGTRYDLGNKLGVVKATVDFALNDPEIRSDVLKYIKEKK